jgi:hypothetical protein
MTIYLYIKTHTITGLKYLGKTKRDPFKYQGSGIDWLSHLSKYGNDHYTEILQECQSKKELSYWGRYYSKHYNIINAQDDYGNNIWANRIPETGGGSNHGGEKHYLYDSTLYSFENIKTKEIIIATQNKFCSIYNLNKGNVCHLIQGKRNRVENWCIFGKNKSIKYTFVNTNTLEKVYMTPYDFWKTYNLCKSGVSSMVRAKNKNLKIHPVKGWIVS